MGRAAAPYSVGHTMKIPTQAKPAWVGHPHGGRLGHPPIRRAAVTARIPTITTLSAARAACEGIAALQRGEAKVYALQQLHAERVAAAK